MCFLPRYHLASTNHRPLSLSENVQRTASINEQPARSTHFRHVVAQCYYVHTHTYTHTHTHTHPLSVSVSLFIYINHPTTLETVGDRRTDGRAHRELMNTRIHNQDGRNRNMLTMITKDGINLCWQSSITTMRMNNNNCENTNGNVATMITTTDEK